MICSRIFVLRPLYMPDFIQQGGFSPARNRDIRTVAHQDQVFRSHATYMPEVDQVRFVGREKMVGREEFTKHPDVVGTDDSRSLDGNDPGVLLHAFAADDFPDLKKFGVFSDGNGDEVVRGVLQQQFMEGVEAFLLYQPVSDSLRGPLYDSDQFFYRYRF